MEVARLHLSGNHAKLLGFAWRKSYLVGAVFGSFGSVIMTFVSFLFMVVTFVFVIVTFVIVVMALMLVIVTFMFVRLFRFVTVIVAAMAVVAIASSEYCKRQACNNSSDVIFHVKY